MFSFSFCGHARLPALISYRPQLAQPPASRDHFTRPNSSEYSTAQQTPRRPAAYHHFTLNETCLRKTLTLILFTLCLRDMCNVARPGELQLQLPALRLRLPSSRLKPRRTRLSGAATTSSSDSAKTYSPADIQATQHR